MKNSSISKIKNVWKTHNNIANPVKQELYLDIIDQVANLFSAGSFYYYILNFETLQMDVVDERTSMVLGIEASEFNLDTILNIIHPEDLERMHEKELTAARFLFDKIPAEDIPLYKVVYLMRLKHADGSYKTILHQSKTIVVSGDGKIQKVLGIHTDVTYLNLPFDHKVSFISSERPSYYSMNTGDEFEIVKDGFHTIFTQREKEILKHIAEG
jgi:hypothetical protein